jgi:hypothetical protein
MQIDSVHEKTLSEGVGWTPVHHRERCHERRLLQLSLLRWARAHPTKTFSERVVEVRIRSTFGHNLRTHSLKFHTTGRSSHPTKTTCKNGCVLRWVGFG